MALPTTSMLAELISRSLRDGDRLTFVQAVRDLIDRRARLRTGWKSITTPLVDYGELDLARRAIDLYVEASGNGVAERFDRVLVYARCGRPREALRMLEEVGRDVPDPASNAYLRGTIALNLGELESARSDLLGASIGRPYTGQIYQTLSMIGSMANETLVAERILQAEPAMRGAAPADRGPYLYALGKTYDDWGEIDRAFAAFEEGAALIAQDRHHDAASDRTRAEAAVEGWRADLVGELSATVRAATDRPIIVTGLPRSGSTLVEHILASHSAVSDGEELGKFDLVVREMGGGTAAAAKAWSSKHGLTGMSQLYLHLLTQRFGASGRVVDKTLEASRYLGTLTSVMPEAPIVWLRRRPLDNAWSCFSTYFLAGLSWSWSQQAMAVHFALEDELLKRWQDILRDRLLVLSYEDLVRDKERTIPLLLDHVGLKTEPAVFSPEKTQRLVSTASLAQVRAPINTRAIGRGDRYADQLGLFADAYRKLGGDV